MQFLASMNNSEQWQLVLSNCQLEKFDYPASKDSHIQALNDTASFCIPRALSLTELANLLVLPKVSVVVSLDSPESVVGGFLQQGKSVSEAVSNWYQLAQSILQLQHQYRRQLQLVQTEGLLINPDQAPNWLAIYGESINSQSIMSSNNIYYLLASQALRQHPDAERCWQKLIACSLPLLEQTQFSFNPDSILKEYVVNKNLQLASSHEESALMQEQLFHVQEELEKQLQNVQHLSDQKLQYEEAFATQKQQLSELQSQLESSKQEQVKSQQELTASNEENALMQEQLFHVQEELERQLQKNQQLSDQAQQHEEAFTTQKQQLSELQSQLEISKQDRAKSKQQLSELQSQLEISKQDQAKSQQQLIASNEENDLILQQLFYVQEELEQQLLTNQELAKQHSKLELDHRNNTAAFLAKYQKSERSVTTMKQQWHETEGKLAISNAEIERLNKQLSELNQAYQQSLQNITELEKQLHVSKQEEVLTKHKLASAQIDLTAVKGSRLWKSVSPVRKLVSAFKSSKAREQLQHNAELITGSEYFDLAWYLHRYPDVVESGVNPAEHYLIFGADEGRSPGPLFDGNWYLSQYPDVAENNTNPLLHYILYGAEEGRAISPRLLQHLAVPSQVESGDENSSNQDTKAAD